MAILRFLSRLLTPLRHKPALPVVAPTSNADALALLAAAVFTRPVGYWLCTHAAPWVQRSGFVPGEAYLCWQDAAGSYRIKPNRDSSWGPYWRPEVNRFCYPDSDMRFTYLGANLPSGRITT